MNKTLLGKSTVLIETLPQGVWLTGVALTVVANQKRNSNLVLGRYTYRREASFKNTINWVCSKSTATERCHARCITRTDGSLKLSSKSHNH